MNCPKCRNVSLETIELEPQLSALHCHRCEGHWLPVDRVTRWLASRQGTLPERTEVPDPQLHDDQTARLCPDCGRIMLRYRVISGVALILDRCGGCSGLWFDAGEWQALRERNLHEELIDLFTPARQRQIQHEEAAARLRALYHACFGTDFERAEEIRRWVREHPQKESLLAFLTADDPYKVG